MSQCKNCKASLSQDAKFCPECGENVKIFCTSCGASISVNASFCGECGEKVAAATELISAKAGNRQSISLGTRPSSLLTLRVNIDSVTVTGPNREKEFSLCVKFKVSNDSDLCYRSIYVSSQIFNSHGQIIREDKDEFDDEIEVGDSVKFETYINSVKAALVGDNPGELKVFLNIYATHLDNVKLTTIQMPSNNYEVITMALESDTEIIDLVSGSVWKAPDWDDDGDHDPSIFTRICIQNKSKSFIPKAKLTLDVLDKGERSVGDRDSYEELVPGGFINLEVDCQIPRKKADGCYADLTLSLYRQVALGNTQSSGVTIEASEEEDEDESGSKRIYIKTEPGGKIVFGKLDDEQTDLLLEAIKSENMPEELLDLRSNSGGDFREYEGVINSGEDGDAGNEGIIEIDSDGPVKLPKDADGNYEDGAYLVYLSLSKVSIEFEFEPSDEKFDSDKFTEISVPIDLPDFIEHDLYGHPSFNVVTGYQYDGEYIEEYDGDLVDRGYDDLTAFIFIKDGEPTLVYKNYNGEEEWR